MKRLILIDSHAIIHRAFHALPPLSTPNNEPTNAVYGFTTILLKMIKDLKPDYIVAAFDTAAPTHRHVAYERYKAQRPETASELKSQFPKVKEVLTAFGIPIFEKEGFEADDIIGTVVKKLEKDKNTEIIIVTGDLDTLQLIRPHVGVYSMKKGISDTVLYDEKAVQERYGLKPNQLIDFKGLKGDPSDNIPGVKGIGEKTAIELIKSFGSIDGVYKALRKSASAKVSADEVKKISGRVAEKLREDEEAARFSKELATIQTNVPVEFKLDGAVWSGEINTPAVQALFRKFGFFSLLKRLANGSEAQKVKTAEAKNVSSQPSLLETTSEKKSTHIKTKEDFLLFVSKLKENKIGAVLLEDELLLTTTRGDVVKIGEKALRSPEVKRFFESGVALYTHDAKTLIRFLRSYGVAPVAPLFDTMLAAYLVGSFGRDFSYTAVVARELGLSPTKPSGLVGDVGGAASEEGFAHFFDVVRSLEKKLAEGEFRKVFNEIELPLAPVLADMEERGILLDVGFLKKLSKKINTELEVLTKAIYKLAGEEFNIKSSQQLSRILFEKLNIRTAGLRKTEKGGVVSTRESELIKLKEGNPIIEKILDYRELMKLKTTYVDVLPKLVNSGTKRIHTTFNQTGTTTGRLSSSDPNLQNIPIMSEYGREIRKAFVAQKGFELASFDYSQIELRVAAHIANDPKMIAAFKKGLDIHKITASEVYNAPLDQVTPEQRRAAKTLNFGILYGMGAQALAEATNMTQDEAKNFIKEYFHDFQGVKKYIEDTKRFAEEQGFVETLFGRRRYIPEIHSSNWQMKREAERMAVNMPIQGTATGDIVKMAMIAVDKWIRKEKLEKDIRMLLQVHDELLFEIKKDTIRRVVPKIKEIMESIVTLKVPLVVDVKIGPSWGRQEKI